MRQNFSTLSAAQIWARQVQSRKMFETGPPNARHIERALNVESRQVLYQLASALKPEAKVVVMEIGHLVQRTGFSGRRIRVNLDALRVGRLIGPWEQKTVAGRVVYFGATFDGGGVMDLAPEIIVDCFAGGGGASEGLEKFLERMGEQDLLNGAARKVAIAINHDDEALAMHAENHPETLHIPIDIWRVDPAGNCPGETCRVALGQP